MKLLIIGGTGKTGRQLLSQGLERGHEITALARNPAKISITHPKLRVVRGNVLSIADLKQAIIGQEAVLSALGHKQFIIKRSILSQGTANMLAVMEHHGPKRLICITTLGINESRFRLGLYYTLFTIPVILYFYFRDKAKQERLIRESSVDWTIVRPGQLTNGKMSGNYRHGTGLGHYIITKMVSRAEVAHFMLEELERRNYVRAVAEITH